MQNTASGDSRGLVRTPNPMENTSNLAITGNLSGGKSFRGNIPYGSTTGFGGRLGSTSLDPFLRYSALPEESSQGPAGSSPFYSPTGTASRIQPGQSNVFAPGSPRIAVGVMQSPADQPTDLMPTSDMPSFPASTARTNLGSSAFAGTWQGAGSLPPATAPEEMRRIIAGEPGVSPTDRLPLTQGKQLLTSEEYQRQLEQLQQDLDRVKTQASQFEQNLSYGRPPSLPAPAQRPTETLPPTYSAEALRRIIQPQRASETMSPLADQDSPATGAALWPSQNPAASLGAQPAPGAGAWAQGSASPDSGFPQTPRLAYGSSGVPQPGGTGAGSSDLALTSPQSLLNRTQGGTFTQSRFRPYGQPTGLELSPSELAAQKRRINGLFPPQTEGAALNDIRPELSEGGPDYSAARPAMPRGQDPARAPNAPAGPGNLLSSAPSAAANYGLSQSQSPPRPIRIEPVPSTVERAQGSASLPGTVPQGRESAFGGAGAIPRDNAQPQSPGSPEPLLTDRTAPKPANVDAASQEKFDRYLQAAQSHVQQGQYARAAEFFSLASVHNPRDARPQIGRCHALLAVGEYLGSAVCLAKAIELDPRLTLRKSDLVEAVGGPDPFIQRITDLEQRAGTSEAPGLQLLLAYVYQQMDRPQEATAAIRVAKKGLPSSASVALLEAAIGGRVIQ